MSIVMNEPTKDEILKSMSSRSKEMEDIDFSIKQLVKKIKQLSKRKDELKSLNILDEILLKELNNGTD